MFPVRRSAVPIALLLVAACMRDAGPRPAADPGAGLPPGVEAISLLGDTLRPAVLSASTAELYATRLAEARADWERDPNVEHAIWLGRRTAYPGQYREAIRIYSDAIAKWPEDARLWRHRGHRWITVREFDRAIEDLRTAARLMDGKPDQVEPDGLPNARNTPTSTLQGNIWYHLGLANYLKGDLDSALAAYRHDATFNANPDSRVATSYWLYMILRRLGRTEEAAAVLVPITADMDIIENGAYHRLLLLYKGVLPVDSLLAPGTGEGASLQDATTGYGVGNWYFYNGDEAKARETWQRVLGTGQWASFGYIAAEAELARTPR